MSAPQVEQVVRDTAAIGELLGRAFCDNPGMRATLGEERPQRFARATRLMKGLTAMTARAGRVEVVRADGRVVGASLSHAPGEVPRGLALAPAAVAVLGMGPTVARRLLRLERFLRTHHMRAPHYFLAILGVEPAMQGRGFSSLLLRALGRRADAARLPCYLETDQEKNVRIYERHGFRVTSEHVLTELSGVKFWLMLRPAGG